MASRYGQYAVNYLGPTPRPSKLSQPPLPPQQHPDFRGQRGGTAIGGHGCGISSSRGSQPHPKPMTRSQAHSLLAKSKHVNGAMAGTVQQQQQHPPQHTQHCPHQSADAIDSRPTSAVGRQMRSSRAVQGLTNPSQSAAGSNGWFNHASSIGGTTTQSQGSLGPQGRPDPSILQQQHQPPMSQASTSSGFTPFQMYQMDKKRQEAHRQPQPQQQQQIHARVALNTRPAAWAIPTQRHTPQTPFKDFVHGTNMPNAPPPLPTGRICRPIPPHHRAQRPPMVSQIVAPVVTVTQTGGEDDSLSTDASRTASTQGLRAPKPYQSSIQQGRSGSSGSGVPQSNPNIDNSYHPSYLQQQQQLPNAIQVQLKALLQESFATMKQEFDMERKRAADHFAAQVAHANKQWEEFTKVATNQADLFKLQAAEATQQLESKAKRVTKSVVDATKEFSDKAKYATSQVGQFALQVADAKQQLDDKVQEANNQIAAASQQLDEKLDSKLRRATTQIDDETKRFLVHAALAEGKSEAAIKRMDETVGVCSSMVDEVRKLYSTVMEQIKSFSFTRAWSKPIADAHPIAATVTGSGRELTTPPTKPTAVSPKTIPVAVDNAASTAQTPAQSMVKKVAVKIRAAASTNTAPHKQTGKRGPSFVTATTTSLSKGSSKHQRRPHCSIQDASRLVAVMKPSKEIVSSKPSHSSTSHVKLVGSTQVASKPKTDPVRQHDEKASKRQRQSPRAKQDAAVSHVKENVLSKSSRSSGGKSKAKCAGSAQLLFKPHDLYSRENDVSQTQTSSKSNGSLYAGKSGKPSHSSSSCAPSTSKGVVTVAVKAPSKPQAAHVDKATLSRSSRSGARSSSKGAVVTTGKAHSKKRAAHVEEATREQPSKKARQKLALPSSSFIPPDFEGFLS